MKLIKFNLTISFIILTILPLPAQKKILKSRIQSVKLYQNQAEITRVTEINLKYGNNKILIGGLPRTLYDWSLKSKLPAAFKGKILSLEVEKKALLNKQQKRIHSIEKKLKDLREEDLVLLDNLKNIRSQLDFLKSILSFTEKNASKELATRIPQVKVWDNTLTYVIRKKKILMTAKRKIEKERELLGKKIQKWEFELSQIAGYDYFSNYQTLNKTILFNRANLDIQQFANINKQYKYQKELLKKPTDKVDIEKRCIIHVYSVKNTKLKLYFTYLIPNTYWQMLYDIRANKKKKTIDLVVFGNIFQKTGEDWENIRLSLSTGSPVSSIRQPNLYPWYLDIIQRRKTGSFYSEKKYKPKRRISSAKEEISSGLANAQQKDIPQTQITESGSYFEITLPLRQTILSSNKYQKKYIREFKLKRKLNFYYEITPALAQNAFLKAKITNVTKIPWLPGQAQVFLQNEFMGKTKIPFTPLKKTQNLAVSTENRIYGKKELVKKFEDRSGLFGGNRRIVYSYKITLENQLPYKTKIKLLDQVPVPRNKKIEVEIKKLSHKFINNEKEKKSSDYLKGIRKWELFLNKQQKIEISYQVVISFDKEISIRGLR